MVGIISYVKASAIIFNFQASKIYDRFIYTGFIRYLLVRSPTNYMI